jgi:hypothetical protein
MISRKLMIGNPQNGAHRWSCAEAEVPCDHAEKGCPALIKRSDLKQHLTGCLFEQLTPYMNTIQEEIEEIKKDREKKSKQIDALLRAQARLNGQLADLRPLSALTAAARRDADPRPSAAELDSDARMARAMEVVRRRRQAQLNAQPIPENIPERPANDVSITARTPPQSHTTPVVSSRPLRPAALVSSSNEELAQINAEMATFRRARQAAHLAREQASIAEEAERISIARSRRSQVPTGMIDPDPDNLVRGTLPIELPDRSSTLRLSDTRSQLPPRDPDSDIQPPSTASMPSSSEVSDTMATQGSLISSSLPTRTADVEASDPSDLAATSGSTSGGSSHQSTNEIALTGNIARLDTSVSSSIVPGDSISNFRLPASADNRAGANTSHGLDEPSRLSEARRIEVENLAISLHLTRDSIMTYHPVALDAPGTTRATAIEIDSDPEDDLDSILDMPMFRPEAFGDMHLAVSHLVERADRMERVLQA